MPRCHSVEQEPGPSSGRPDLLKGMSRKQPGLHINGDDGFIGSPDKVPVMSISKLYSIITLPKHGFAIENEAQPMKKHLNLPLCRNEADWMRLDVTLRNHNAQSARPGPDALKLDIIPEDQIAQTQTV